MIKYLRVINMKALKTVFGLIGAISATAAIIIYCTEKFTDYLFLAGETNSDRALAFLAAVTAFSVIAYSVVSIIIKRNKSAIFKTVIRLAASCAILYYALILSALTRSCNYYEFVSPDKQYSVIANEWSYLMGGGINFYERINPLFVQEKESLTVDDGVNIINAKAYSVEWQNNAMTFTFSNGSAQSKSVTVELSKQHGG